MNNKSTYSDYQILFAKYLDGSATEEELENVLRITRHNVEATNQLHQMRRLKASMDIKKNTKSHQEAYKLFLEIINKSLKSMSFRSLWYSISSAAAITILIVGYLFLYTLNNNVNESFIVQTQDSVRDISLEDGSLVTLNKQSQIVIAQDFNTEKREIFLEGEAFFEVTASKKEFIVHVKNIQVRVVGTKFNVFEDTLQSIISVHVQEGVVSVACDSNMFTVNSGEYFVYNTLNNVGYTQPQIYAADSWKTGTYVFENAYLSEVLNILNERFNTSILYSNDLDSVQINATFHDADSTELVPMLQLILQAEVTMSEHGAFLHR